MTDPADTRLSDADIDARLAGSSWQREGATIVRELELENFAGAIAAVNRVAAAAEAADHHPDILVHSWNRLRLALSTHSAGGLTQADVDLAAQLDAVL